jgi:hypothetical protein
MKKKLEYIEKVSVSGKRICYNYFNGKESLKNKSA